MNYNGDIIISIWYYTYKGTDATVKSLLDSTICTKVDPNEI